LELTQPQHQHRAHAAAATPRDAGRCARLRCLSARPAPGLTQAISLCFPERSTPGSANKQQPDSSTALTLLAHQRGRQTAPFLAAVLPPHVQNAFPVHFSGGQAICD